MKLVHQPLDLHGLLLIMLHPTVRKIYFILKLEFFFVKILRFLIVFYWLVEDGLDWINKEFKFCKALKTKSDVTGFKDFLNDLWTNVAMMDYPYKTTFLMPLPGII